MSRMRYQGGWLLYGGNLGTIAAEVLDADISVQMSRIDVSSFSSPLAHSIRGPVSCTFTAQLYEEMEWDRGRTGTQRPHMAALLALARKHPEEYEDLREREDVLKALGG